MAYKKKGDFVGMDMARKFLQMGYTRSRRYANHKSGRKYSSEDKDNPVKIPPTPTIKMRRIDDIMLNRELKKYSS